MKEKGESAKMHRNEWKKKKNKRSKRISDVIFEQKAEEQMDLDTFIE